MFQMIGAEWCDKCRQARKLLQERGLWDFIEYIDYDSLEGKRIAKKLGVDTIPFFVEDGKLIQYVGEMLHRLTEKRIMQAYEEHIDDK
jgi:arsenate reductase-like glutaredoxin family protein